MYVVFMLHLIGESCMYLGSVAMTTPEETDDAVEIMEELWQRYQQSQPEHEHLFIEWLEQQDEANEVSYDEESPNLPLQVYLR